MELPSSVVFFVMVAPHSRGVSKSFAEVRDALMNGDDFNKLLSSSSNEPLNALIERARTHVMTPEEKQAQRESFAYGNVKLHNDSITREMAHVEAKKLKGHKTTSHDELVVALRKRIDEQEEVLKGYFVRVKELEGLVESATTTERERIVSALVKLNGEFSQIGNMQAWAGVLEAIKLVSESKQ